MILHKGKDGGYSQFNTSDNPYRLMVPSGREAVKQIGGNANDRNYIPHGQFI